MSSERFSLEDKDVTTSQPGFGAAFVAMPALMAGVVDAASFQRELYKWAFEQAQQMVRVSRPSPMRDLFSIMN
jgi:hypothetical protein